MMYELSIRLRALGDLMNKLLAQEIFRYPVSYL